MALDFPSSPTTGQQVTIGGVTWTFDGVKWTAGGTGAEIYLPLTGGTMTGDITLKGDPSAPLHPVTYRMVSNPNDNRLVNGDMRIDQRNNGASGTAASVYTVDRWICNQGVGLLTWGRNLFGLNGPLGFPYYLGIASATAHVIAAGDSNTLSQPVEADMVSDFQWGTASAQSVTLSFWVYSSLTGTFGGSIRNAAATRSYPFSFSIPVLNTWTKVVVTIPGDTGGTWVMSGNAQALSVIFDLGTGTTFRAPAGAWAAGNFTGANGAVSVLATNGASYLLTGVKLEIGSVATPYNRQSLAKSLADCQRYYSTTTVNVLITAAAASAYANTSGALPVTMRAIPTIVATLMGSDVNVTALAVDNIQAGSFRFYGQSVAAGLTQATRLASASAEL